MRVKLNTTLKFDEHLIPGGTILIDDDIPQVILDLVEQGSPHVEVISASVEEMNAPVIDHDELDEIIGDPDKIEDEAEEVAEASAKEDAPKLKRRGK